VAGLSAYFLDNEGVSDAMFLPEMLFLRFSVSMQHFE
jgi:hypothetical protein